MPKPILIEAEIDEGPDREEANRSIDTSEAYRVLVSFKVLLRQAARESLVKVYGEKVITSKEVELQAEIEGKERRDGSGEDFQLWGRLRPLKDKEGRWLIYSCNYRFERKKGVMTIQVR